MILIKLIVTALTILGFIVTLLFFISLSCFTDNWFSKSDRILYTVLSGVLLIISIGLIITVIILWA